MLSGNAVVVPLDWPAAGALARRLVEAGGSVVLVGDDGARAGVLLRDLESVSPGKASYFHLEGDDVEPLVEFLSEQFRP